MKNITLNLNGKFMPVDRGNMFEDPLDDFLRKNAYGFVDGGGTSMYEDGEIDSVDVEITLNDGIDAMSVIAEMENFLAKSVGVPNKSKWIVDEEQIVFGEYDGVGLYLDINHEEPDMNQLKAILNGAFDYMGNEVLYTANRLTKTVTVVYFYGSSYTTMSKLLVEFMSSQFSNVAYELKNII